VRGDDSVRRMRIEEAIDVDLGHSGRRNQDQVDTLVAQPARRGGHGTVAPEIVEHRRFVEVAREETGATLEEREVLGFQRSVLHLGNSPAAANRQGG
jgi:hypothetical protein